MPTPSREGYLYWVPFIDDKSRFGAIDFMKTKDETLSKLKRFHTWATNQKGTKIKLFRTDEGGEYTGKEIQAYLQKEGIQPEFTASDSPHQNGVAERRNRQLAEITCCLLKTSGMGPEWWVDTMQLANWIINRAPTRALEDTTPFEDWYQTEPDLSRLHVFGSRAEVYIEGHKAKLDPRTKTCIYLGPNYQGEGCRFYDPNTKRIIVSHSTTFFEEPEGLYPSIFSGTPKLKET